MTRAVRTESELKCGCSSYFRYLDKGALLIAYLLRRVATSSTPSVHTSSRTLYDDGMHSGNPVGIKISGCSGEYVILEAKFSWVIGYACPIATTSEVSL
jgi:hypothetical protein